MGILTKEVEVKVNSYTIKHYESLGYTIPLRKASKSSFQHTGKEFVYDLNNIFTVKVGDLPKRSNVKIDVICDVCGEVVHGITYEHYCESMDTFGEYACKKCKTKHYKESCLRNYGVDNSTKSKKVYEQMIQTSLQRYGTIHPMQSSKIKEKAVKTLYKNSSQKTSKQQHYICNLYKGILNFPLKYYNLDICFPEEKLCIEYDGGGHNLAVVTGKITKEEFNQKEIIRNAIIKREGYKQMRIISSTDKLPLDSTLFQMLSYTKEYFSKYPEHSWIEYNIDSSSIRSAEHKDGIFFNYGDLRTIKDSNLKTV